MYIQIIIEDTQSIQDIDDIKHIQDIKGYIYIYIYIYICWLLQEIGNFYFEQFGSHDFEDCQEQNLQGRLETQGKVDIVAQV